MNSFRARITALTLTGVLAAMMLAACGSSSSTSSSSAAAAVGGAGAPGNSAARTKLTACLKQHGVTLPSRPAGAHRPAGGSGGGGYGGAGFFGGGMGRPGSGAGGRFGNPKTRAAFQTCVKQAGGQFGRGRNGVRPGAGGQFRPTAAAITTFAACVKRHGYALPKPNLSGKGAIYPTSVEKNATFQRAARACSADLRPAGRG